MCYPPRSTRPRVVLPLQPKRRMKRILFILSTLVVCALQAEAAMVRVIDIENGRTLTIDDRGTRASIRLAGVAITDELRARELLKWTLKDAWVMLERIGDDVLVYRSPDALFINRELVLRGCARATLAGIEPDNRPAVTYLGEVNPQGPQSRATSPAPAPRSGSGTSRRSGAPPSRRPPGSSGRRSAGSGRQTPSATSPGAQTGAPRSRGSSR